MGTTVVIALFTKEYLLFGNIGDSSGYVMKQGKLTKVTHDHTIVGLLLKNGEKGVYPLFHHFGIIIRFFLLYSSFSFLFL